MGKKAETVLADIGKQLAQQSTTARLSKDSLLKLLLQAAGILVELDQNSSLKPFISPFTHSLVKLGLLRHRDKDVRLLVSVSFCEVLRILAPDPSFDDKLFKDIFELFIGMFKELPDTSSPYFSRRVRILDTVATLECCRRMLDLGCHDLILKLFSTFFSVVREEHQQTLVSGMLSIMSLILNEEEEIPQPLLEVILRNLTNKGEDVVPASHHLAVALVQNCAERVKPAVCGFLMSCITDRDSSRSDLKECYHEVIFEISKCTPHMLLAVIPNLVEELVSDQVDVRIRSVNLIGKLLGLPKDYDVHGSHHLFIELLKRFSDRSAEVRISVIRAVKSCYMANPSGTESHKILSSLEGRLLDLDASVRAEAVAVVSDLGKFSLKNFPEVIIARITDRLRDKMTSVRKEAVKKLLEVYREYCFKCYEGQMPLSECYEQIPCKILVLSLDKNLKEFRPQNLELLLAGDLFPASLTGEESMRHWIYLYSLFTPVHVKALNLILSQKRRFQIEMRSYLSLCLKEKGIDHEEVDMRIKNAFTQMSATFLNPVKAEESFCKLNQLKDHGILRPLVQLLDEPLLLNAKIKRDKFLKDIGEKHSLFEFLELLSLKCSNNIFSSEHVRHILDHVSGSEYRESLSEDSAFELFSDVVRHFPFLLRGSEDLFKKLITEDNSAVSGGLLQILAKVGRSISLELSEIYPLLERLCLEGSRAQSKVAISVIAASISCLGQSLLVNLCQKLLEALHRGWKTPTVLQSLGCIFQHSDLAFQQHENEVSSYIRERIFENQAAEDTVMIDEKSGCYVSSNCKLKIYGIKALVRSVLPYQGTHGGDQISNLLDLLSEVLLTGEFANATSACESDTALLRLAAAKSILRLSRRWDMHISPRIYQSTIMMAKDTSPLVRKMFIDKIHLLLKRNAASRKFACALALAASDSTKDLQDVSLKYLTEFVKEYGRAPRICLASSKEGSMTNCPEYMVVFLLHVLAHDAGFPSTDSHDDESFAQFCRPLVIALHVLVNAQSNGKADLVNKNFLQLRSIFRAIRRAEDAVDPDKTLKLHILADIGILTLKVIQPDGIDVSRALGLVLLPSSLYGTSASRTTSEANRDGRRFVDEDSVRKLVHNFECDFSQISSSTTKRGQSLRKDKLLAQNVVDLLGSKQTETLRNLTTQRKVAGKEMTKNPVLEACPKGKKQTTVNHFSKGSLPLQDGSSVIEALEGDYSENLGHLRGKEREDVHESENLELFGIQSDISTEELDVSASYSQKDDRKRKSSNESAVASKLSETILRHGCSSDGSAVCSSRQRYAKKCVEDCTEETVTVSGEGTAEMQGLGNIKRKILVDTTNSFPVNGLLKNCQPKRSCKGHKSYSDTSVSDISDENKDAIAFRTRRRRV